MELTFSDGNRLAKQENRLLPVSRHTGRASAEAGDRFLFATHTLPPV